MTSPPELPTALPQRKRVSTSTTCLAENEISANCSKAEEPNAADYSLTRLHKENENFIGHMIFEASKDGYSSGSLSKAEEPKYVLGSIDPHEISYGTTCIALIYKGDSIMFCHDGRLTSMKKEEWSLMKRKLTDDQCAKCVQINPQVYALRAGDDDITKNMLDNIKEKLEAPQFKDGNVSSSFAAQVGVDFLKAANRRYVKCIFMGLKQNVPYICVAEGGTNGNQHIEPRAIETDLPGILEKGSFAAIGSGSDIARKYLAEKMKIKSFDTLDEEEVVGELSQAMLRAALEDPATGGAIRVYRFIKGQFTALNPLKEGVVIDLYHQFYNSFEEEAKSEKQTLFVLCPQKTERVFIHDNRIDKYFRDFGKIICCHTIGSVSGCHLRRYVFNKAADASVALKSLSELQLKIQRIPYTRNPEIGKLDMLPLDLECEGNRAYVGKASKELLWKIINNDTKKMSRAEKMRQLGECEEARQQRKKQRLN